MKFRNAIFSVLLASACAHASAPGWDVEVLGTEAWAVGEKLRLPMIRSGVGDPEILGWARPEGAHPQIRLLRYVAGEQGSSESLLEVRGLVYRLDQKKILADEPLAYVKPGDVSKKLGAQPVWTWTEKLLLIESLDAEQPIKVKLGN